LTGRWRHGWHIRSMYVHIHGVQLSIQGVQLDKCVVRDVSCGANLAQATDLMRV